MSEPFSLSFEFFPPKTSEGMQQLKLTAKMLAKLEPNFFSVTFGAGGSTRDGTIETVKMLQHHYPVPVAPHLSCIGSEETDLLEIIECYRALDVRRMVILRGDLPSGMGQSGEFKHATELVKLVRAKTGDYFHLDVAAYPECHPQSINAIQDVLHFKDKIDAGANNAITQYFYNPDSYFYFRDECERQGITVPIVPGIMPITHYKRLMRFSQTCGAEVPQWIRRRLEAYEEDEMATKTFGLEVVSRLCQELIDGGAPGLHFYTLNQSDATLMILDKINFKSVNRPRNINENA